MKQSVLPVLSFNGVLAYLQGTFIPKKLHGLHQALLDELKRKAEARVASASTNNGATP